MSPASSHILPDLTGTFVDEGYLQLMQLLGCGGYAKVYKAVDTTSSTDDPVYYAVKCMRNGAPGSSEVAILQNEFHMHKDVSHEPGVVTFHRVFTDGEGGEFVFMVLDLAPAGDMLGFIKSQHYVDRPALVADTFMEVLDAVEQCHENGVFHRDLKPQNFLCNSTGTGIRLADFGMATSEDESQVFRCGTLAFMSPECADHTPRVSYSPRESDFWALGVVLFALVTSTTPWPVAEMSEPKYAAFRADPDHYLADTFQLTPAANDFFRWCFTADPATRPSILQMRAAVRNIERFSLAHMIPRAPAVAKAVDPPMLSLSALFTSSRLFTPALISGIPTPSSSSSSSVSSAGPSTPSLFTEPPIAIADLLDAANVGLAAVHPPPLVPTKLHAHPSVPVRAKSRIVIVPPPPIKMAPEYRFLDRKKRNISTRQRFANKMRRI